MKKSRSEILVNQNWNFSASRREFPVISTFWKLPLVDARFWLAVSKVANESGEAAFVAQAKIKNNFILKKYFILL